jgi:hypothetical protein
MECGEELMGMEMNHEWRRRWRWFCRQEEERERSSGTGCGWQWLPLTASLWLTSNTCVYYNNNY